jgi:putative DNA methylase
LRTELTSLVSSIVLVRRGCPENAQTVTRADFLRALLRQIPDAVDKIRKASVGWVDIPRSVIDPGIGVFTYHTKDGDSPLTIRTAVALIVAAPE